MSRFLTRTGDERQPKKTSAPYREESGWDVKKFGSDEIGPVLAQFLRTDLLSGFGTFRASLRSTAFAPPICSQLSADAVRFA
jgi:hypothetical protein